MSSQDHSFTTDPPPLDGIDPSFVFDFTDLGGRTKMVMTHTGVPSDSPGAMGWTMALDKLATRLATLAGR